MVSPGRGAANDLEYLSVVDLVVAGAVGTVTVASLGIIMLLHLLFTRAENVSCHLGSAQSW